MKRRIDATTELQDALQRRADGTTLSAEDMADVQAEITALCRELGKRESDFAEGGLMTDEAYFQALSEIDVLITEQLKKLTRDAMTRAKLDRLRIEAGQ